MVHRSVWGPSPGSFGGCAVLAAGLTAPAAADPDGSSASALAPSLAAGALSLRVGAEVPESPLSCSDARIPSMMAPSCAAFFRAAIQGLHVREERRDAPLQGPPHVRERCRHELIALLGHMT